MTTTSIMVIILVFLVIGFFISRDIDKQTKDEETDTEVKDKLTQSPWETMREESERKDE